MPLFVTLMALVMVFAGRGRRASVHAAAILACARASDGAAPTLRAQMERGRLDDGTCAPADDLFAGLCLPTPLAPPSIAAAAFVERAPIAPPFDTIPPARARDAARARGPPA